MVTLWKSGKLWWQTGSGMHGKDEGQSTLSELCRDKDWERFSMKLFFLLAQGKSKRGWTLSAVWVQRPASSHTSWHIPGTAAQPAPSAAPAPCPRAGRWDSPPARCTAPWRPWCPPLSEPRRTPSLPAGAPSHPPRWWIFWGRAEASLWDARQTRVHKVNVQRWRITQAVAARHKCDGTVIYHSLWWNMAAASGRLTLYQRRHRRRGGRGAPRTSTGTSSRALC